MLGDLVWFFNSLQNQQKNLELFIYMARELCEDKSRNIISSGGFCYSDVSSSNPTLHQTHMMNQIQGFEGNHEIFNLTTGMEMIGFSKNLQQHTSDNNSVMWKEFFNNKPAGNNPGPSSSKTINESTTSDHHFYQHDHQFNKQDFTTGMPETSGENLIVGHDHSDVAGAWQENNSRLLVDDSSLRCVFPCEGNERPSQGLSLSLSSSNPSSIGLQSFELRQTNHNDHDHQQDDMRFISSSTSREGFFGKPAAGIQQQQQMMQDGFLGKPAIPPNIHHQTGHQFQLRNSKYLAPAQDILNEFCSLGTKQNDATKLKSNKAKQQWNDENAGSSSRKQSLCSLEFMELQKRKTKLLSMLEEVFIYKYIFSSILFLKFQKDPFFSPIFSDPFFSPIFSINRGKYKNLFLNLN